MFRAFRGSISLPKFGRIKGIYRGMVGHGVRVYPTHGGILLAKVLWRNILKILNRK